MFKCHSHVNASKITIENVPQLEKATKTDSYCGQCCNAYRKELDPK